ncbi:MAG: hypothetical protein HY820_28665 [Acidobacteria bacterium]|nr:hypothetical protein [Acidobacteriota bacterium]
MTIKILVSRHSAFYSPLIATIAGGFLKQEGLDATYGVLQPGQTSREMLRAGEAHVIQSAVSSSWLAMEKGETDLPVHFAQINCRDGFKLVCRRLHDFAWPDLHHNVLLADHGTQPMAMLRYACHINGVNRELVRIENAGSPEEMTAAYLAGRGDYVHLQGPAADQLEVKGKGFELAKVGAAMPEVAFSSLTALPGFPSSEMGQAFLRAYRAAREWVQTASYKKVREVEMPYFPGYAEWALEGAIFSYQRLGCWKGGIEITRELYEQALEVFLFNGLITRRHSYEDVVRNP